MNIQDAQPSTLREMIKQGKLTGHTSGMAKGYVQANVVILPSKYAYDFLLFCFRNPKTCPLLDVSEKGNKSFTKYGVTADISTEVAAYRIYQYGELIETRANVDDLYTDDMVSFLIGCSFTFEHALLEAG
ncbi:DUF1445 domain-containing protein, partial [Enterococcus faecalis]|nr:DUF1445 domain-containing protein [Enterococcus faecalis]